MTETLQLVCPGCRVPLRREQGSLSCPSCGLVAPIEDGVPVFVDSPEYWGEVGISRERAQEVNRRMATEDWRTVVGQHEAADVRQYFRFVSNMDRIGWHTLLSLPRTSRVLDIGAGLGTMSYALSRCYDQVVAVERVRERVDFMRLRFRQDRAENITLIRTDMDTLPFAEGSFDLIVLNGVSDHSFAEALANGHIVQAGADVLVGDASGSIVTLANVSLSSLHASDFLFG